MSKSKRKD